MEYRKTNEVEGLPPKLTDTVEKILKKGKRYFGSSGASLSHQMYNPKYKEEGLDESACQAGFEGEKATSRLLRDWIKDKENAVLVDSIHIPGQGKEKKQEDSDTMDIGDTDHVLIIGNTVILFDSKAWKNKTSYKVSDDGRVLRGKKGQEFSGSHVNMNAAYYLWANYLKQFNIELYAYIVITNKETFILRDKFWWRQKYKLINHQNILDYKDDEGTEIEGWLNKLYNNIREEDKTFINVDLVSMIVRGAIKPYDRVKEMLGSELTHMMRK